LFGGLKLEHIQAAVERSRVQQMDSSDYVEKATVVKFCRWLLDIKPRAFVERPRALDRFSEFERRNLRNLARFREICSKLTENHHPDAFHLWTAEVNAVDYFVLADQKFINAMTMTSRITLRTKLVSPRELLQDLGIVERDPMPP
jgi:hypothetical protein